jgi:hypothetical protein
MYCIYDFEKPGISGVQNRILWGPAQLFKMHETRPIPDRYLLWLHLLVCFICLFDDVVSSSAMAENKNLIGKDEQKVTA